MTELRSDQLFIRYGILDQTKALGKVHQTIDGIVRYFGVVKRSVTFDQAGDQFRFVSGEQPPADCG